MASVTDKHTCTGAILAGKGGRFNQSKRGDKTYEKVFLLAGRLEAGTNGKRQPRAKATTLG